MTKFFYETDSGASGYIDADTIEEARAKFSADYPEVAPECAGIWAPTDPEYPASTA